ncbi:flavodoxin family protein [Streptomyces cyaneochromogenes]|uniref:Flavodoxin family protein n=2 Tax=Streptomyces cyaneochromogenes TaxID=2496836 RepID=A0A3Q9F1L3_9ACTN|nr:flavodoxin family protein [Streptomyces cyaneochromogenes]AZQ40965.1 flavodoxin family protein [Streptomyces cyaneochromogenes]
MASAIADGAEKQGAQVHLIRVASLNEHQWELMAASNGVIFGSPTYIGGPTASFVAFAEETAGRQMTSHWTDTLASGFTTGAAMAGGKLHTLNYMLALAMQHSMIWAGQSLPAGWNTSTSSPDDANRLGYRLGTAAQANIDQGPEGLLDSDLATATEHGRRVAELATRMRQGAQA